VRYTRHELKQDKFAETALETIQEVLEHRRGLLQIGIAAVVLAILAGGISWYMSSQGKAANDALGQAMVLYNAQVVPPGTPKQDNEATFYSDQERLIAAKTAFYGISNKYGWTLSGQYAHYMAAISEMQLGNNTIAESQLLDVSRSHRREIAALAKYALASVYMDEKRDQDAVKLLQALIDKPTIAVPKVKAQLALADLYTSQQQPDKAKVVYDQIAKENPKNSLGQLVQDLQAPGTR
jgi:tetratricopeptide (TPR) repeat protein